MIRHIVFFKHSSHPIILELKQKLDEMSKQISYALHFETGLDVLGTPRSFNLALVADFEDLDALARYGLDENHKIVVDWIKLNEFETKTVDYVVS